MKVMLAKAGGALVPVDQQGVELLAKPKRIRVRSGLLLRRSYNAWRALKERCDNPKHQYFYLYGGAGIRYCAKWADYRGFLDDMGEPDGYMEIDRIDSGKDYCKANCRWVTREQNSSNRRGWSISGYKGVWQRPSGRWAAVINVNNRMVTLGTFDDILDAARAYNNAATERYGKYARLNVIGESVE